MSKIRIRQILTGLFLLVVVAATLNFGILPQYNSFQERIQEAAQVDTLTGVELDELSRLQELAKIQPAIENQLEYLETSIPLDIQISGFVDILDVLAARNDIEIEFLRIGEVLPYLPPEGVLAEESVEKALERTNKRLIGVPVDFSVIGTYANLVSFMDELQKSPRTTVIQEVSMSSATSSRAYSLTLQTLIFSIGLPAEE